MERAVKVKASVITSDPYQERDLVMPDVNTCTRKAAKEAYEMAGVGPEAIDLVELHDCFVGVSELAKCAPSKLRNATEFLGWRRRCKQGSSEERRGEGARCGGRSARDNRSARDVRSDGAAKGGARTTDAGQPLRYTKNRRFWTRNPPIRAKITRIGRFWMQLSTWRLRKSGSFSVDFRDFADFARWGP